MRTAFAFLLAALTLRADLKLIVSAVDPKTFQPVTGLTAADFELTDGGTRSIKSCEPGSGPADYILLVDTSMVGGAVQALARDLIGQLAEGEQMAVIGFDASATVLQDFTSSRDLLLRSLDNIQLGNSPRILDALFAALESGFQPTNARRVAIVATPGVEGPSRSSERDVIRLARRAGASVYPVFLAGMGRGYLEPIARGTGGASILLRDKNAQAAAAKTVFGTVRSYYVLTAAGNLSLTEKAKIVVRGREKLMVSLLPVE
jgi:VWFA-related protein